MNIKKVVLLIKNIICKKIISVSTFKNKKCLINEDLCYNVLVVENVIEKR